MWRSILSIFFLSYAAPTAVVAVAQVDRTLEHEVVIAAPVTDVWAAWTTADGFQSWAVARAEIDLRVGGDIRSSYSPESDLHDEHTIVNRILAYEPLRMLAIQNIQAPKGFANAELFQKAWSVIYFTPKSDNETHIRIVGLGYGEGAEWDSIYDMFKAGNAYTLDKLSEKFAGAPKPETADSEALETKPSVSATADQDQPVAAGPEQGALPSAWELIHRLVGGEWIHQSKSESGAVIRVRNVLTPGPDGQSVIGNSWFGNADGMTPHGNTIVYREPGTRLAKFINVNERGDVAQGYIRTIGDNTLEWDWNIAALDGRQQSLRALIQLVDYDHYDFTVLDLGKPEGEQRMVEIKLTRVGHCPPAFKTLVKHPE